MTPFRIAKPRFLAYFLFEGALIFAVLYGLATLTTHVASLGDLGKVQTVASITGLFSLLLLVAQWANVGDSAGSFREIVLFSLISVVLSALSFATLWALRGDLQSTVSRLDALLFLEGAIAVPLAVAFWRWLCGHLNILDATRETVLIVGTGETARQVCRWIVSSHSSEYAVLGFVDEDDSRIGTVLAMGVRIQIDYRSLPRFAPRRVDRIIVALDEKRGRLPVRQLMELRLMGLEIEEATTFFERISGKISVETMLPSWLIFSEGFKTSALRSLLKRTADLIHSTILLVVASPLIVITAVAIVLDSGLPVLYRQSRVGRDGREFNLLKFRSMRQDAERLSGPTWAQPDDPRVTRVGRVIRFLRVDELPQLFNVFRGEMSFVGPRPERGHFVRQLEERIPYYGLRTTVRPGLTGWAQVEYRYGASDEDALEKLKYDLYYIKNNNLLLDLWIVLKTIVVVLRGSGAR